MMKELEIKLEEMKRQERLSNELERYIKRWPISQEDYGFNNEIDAFLFWIFEYPEYRSELEFWKKIRYLDEIRRIKKEDIIVPVDYVSEMENKRILADRIGQYIDHWPETMKKYEVIEEVDLLVFWLYGFFYTNTFKKLVKRDELLKGDFGEALKKIKKEELKDIIDPEDRNKYADYCYRSLGNIDYLWN